MGILVYYLLATMMARTDPPLLAREAILVLAVASIYLAAWGHAWQQRRAPGPASRSQAAS